MIAACAEAMLPRNTTATAAKVLIVLEIVSGPHEPSGFFMARTIADKKGGKPHRCGWQTLPAPTKFQYS
jgi:hypothetical protein